MNVMIQVGVKDVETGGWVEDSPNVRKSAELRAMEISKVKEERKVDV